MLCAPLAWARQAGLSFYPRGRSRLPSRRLPSKFCAPSALPRRLRVTDNLQAFCLTISTAFKAVSAPRGRGCYLVLALCLCFPFLLIAGGVTGTSFAQSVEWEKVDAAIGRKATVSGDVHRYGFPRTDLNVSLDDVTLKPAFALGGWVAFKPMNAEVMVM